MRDEGYVVDDVDEQQIRTDVQDSLVALYDRDALLALHAAGQAQFFPLAQYADWFAHLPAEVRNRIENYWGNPESMSVSWQDEGERFQGFLIPCVDFGNVRIMVQPSRYEANAGTSDTLRKKRIYHKSKVPLSHTYLATYLFLRKEWHTHALVHFGTHGTLEWAPGKQRALSANDDPHLALGPLPNIYPYIMDNLGEATTAKRRGRATMISHLTPMFSPAGFRPGLHEMHDLMHDWETVSPGPVRHQMEKQLVEAFVEHQLDRDLGWSKERIIEQFSEFMDVLHPYLDDIAQTAQPQGLAVFGEIPSDQRRFGMVMQMLRKPLIETLGEDIDEVFLLDAEKVTNSRPARWLRLALQDAEAASHLDLRKIDGLDASKQTSVPNRSSHKILDTHALRKLALRARQLDAVLSSNQEIESLLSALDGDHVPSGYGGDPVRNPDSLPTGRNVYGFDPTRVPSQQSWKIGVGVLDDWLETYRETHDGDHPEQIAFTLWAGETMRHHGVMESQVFHALGVQPQWNDSGRITGIDIVPTAELGRPRIDVLISVTGSYRDQFPQLMHWIDKAVVMAAQLNESQDGSVKAHQNFVLQHANALQQTLEAKGISTTDAIRQSTARVFSNEPGAYGTGLNAAAHSSDLWDAQSHSGGDAEMRDLFVNRMGFAYGGGLDGVAAADLFSLQITNLDAVFMSRSSSTYGVLTSDDPFAYLGGFALASRAAGHQPPELYVQNLRDTSEVIVDSAASAIAKEMQTRYLHPQWIKSQIDEGYSGTLQILKATQFLWGWQVTAPETVREDQWQSLAEVYLDDRYDLGTREWFEQSNHQALAQILERMIDSIRLDYWQPDATTQDRIFSLYERARRESDLIESNGLVSQFVAARRKPDTTSPPTSADSVAATPSADSPMVTDPSQQAAPKESLDSEQSKFVRGQLLRPVAHLSNASNHRQLALRGIVALLILVGGLWQYRRFSNARGSSS